MSTKSSNKVANVKLSEAIFDLLTAILFEVREYDLFVQDASSIAPLYPLTTESSVTDLVNLGLKALKDLNCDKDDIIVPYHVITQSPSSVTFIRSNKLKNVKVDEDLLSTATSLIEQFNSKRGLCGCSNETEIQSMTVDDTILACVTAFITTTRPNFFTEFNGSFYMGLLPEGCWKPWDSITFKVNFHELRNLEYLNHSKVSFYFRVGDYEGISVPEWWKVR